MTTVARREFLPAGRRASGNLARMAPSLSVGAASAHASRDNEAWLVALSGDGPEAASAQKELRRLLLAGLVRALSRRGVGADVCEDFAQEALVRIRERLSEFRGESRFLTWALAIATRIAFDELRHKRWSDVSFETASADAQLPLVFEPRVEASQERGLARERVLKELRDVLENKLTDKQRAVLVAELNGMPHAEIAISLGMNRNALYKLSHDARKRVKAQLQQAEIHEGDVLAVFE